MGPERKVSVVILNWNGAKDTIRCLVSFSQLEYANYELIVVDNGSTDDSVRRIQEGFPTVRVIEVGRNLGYSGGNNTGIRYALKNGAAYVLIVNNDTEVVNPCFLRGMIRKMAEDPSIGIMGPKVLNPGNQVQDTILFIPRLCACMKASFALRFGTRTRRDYGAGQQVPAVSGVCWLIRKEVVETVGFLDEDYFMYVEEQDYCYRATRAHWRIIYDPVESILHYKEPNDSNVERRDRQHIYARRNLVLFLRKHFGFCRALLLASLFLVSGVLRMAFHWLTGKQGAPRGRSSLSVLARELKHVLCTRWKRCGTSH